MGKLQEDLWQKMVLADELEADLEAKKKRAQDLAAEMEDKSRTIEQLNRQLVGLKASQMGESLRLRVGMSMIIQVLR